jgi:hypothetical protein
MTRPRIVLGPNGAYWVGADTARGLPVFRTPWAAELLVATLAYFRQALDFRLYGFAVLPTGLQAVIQPGAARGGAGAEAVTISKIMMEIKGSFAHWYNRRTGRSGSVWEKRFADRVLLDAEEIVSAARAVHLTPVSYDLVDRPDLYPYSGLAAARHPVSIVDALPVKTGQLPAVA